MSTTNPRPNQTHPKERLTKEEREIELAKCLIPRVGVHYFVNEYVFIENATLRQWVPFHLWYDQKRVLDAIILNQYTIVLKARQLGLSWLCLSYACWELTCRPGSHFSVWSLREKEAVELLSRRLAPMIECLPSWMRPKLVTDNSNIKAWDNNSVAKAFSGMSGDGETNSTGLIDEADLTDFEDTLGRAKPTVDNGGKLIAISRSNKDKPASTFKKTFRGALEGDNEWFPIFLPWYAHPGRDQAWFDAKVKDGIINTGSDDQRKAMYPATIQEALEAAVLDKRIPPEWLRRVYHPQEPLSKDTIYLEMPGSRVPASLRVFKLPSAGGQYTIGVDPAEGNPTSDFSAFHVYDKRTGEQVAVFSQRVEIDYFCEYIIQTAAWYNDAQVLVERNNHGHAVLKGLRGHVTLLRGQDRKIGWLTNAVSKSYMYEMVTQQIRDLLVTLHDEKTFLQLCDIEGNSLRAPDGLHDDDATASALGLLARVLEVGSHYAEDNAPSILDDRGD